MQKDMIRVALYVRGATEKSVLKKYEQGMQLVKEKGWTLVDCYIELGSTNKKNRTEYKRLLEDMKTDKFDIVVTESIESLTRTLDGMSYFESELNKQNKQLYFYNEGKFYNPEDRLANVIKIMILENSDRQMSRRVKNSYKYRAKQG